MTEQRQGERIRVYVCDDYFLIREGVKAALASAPDVVVAGEAESAEQALEQVVEQLPDVVLMDVALPGIDGIEATRRLRSAAPSVKVIALTRYEDTAHILQLYRAGAVAYLPKGVRAPELLDAIRTTQAGGVILHPRVADEVLEAFAAADPVQSAALSPLSPHEAAVLRQVARGCSNRQIADALSLHLETVQNHLANILRKLELNDRIGAAMDASSRGPVD